MFFNLEHFLISYASHVHLAIFAPLVSFFDEILPIIPSPSIMITTGAIASLQHYNYYGLLMLAIIGAVGKTLGSTILYFIVDKVEDLLAGKISKFFGITPEQIKSFGARLSQNWKDYIILTVLRALPFMPSSLLSVGCGLLKVRLKLFLISSFIGSIIRDFIYIYLGFNGTRVAIYFFKKNTISLESTIVIIVITAVLVSLGWLYYKQKKAKV